MLKISKVYKNQIASEVGIRKGDIILAFDGFEAVDVLDYLFYDNQPFFTLTVKSGDEEIDFEIEKSDDESLGLEFVSDNLEVKTCYNKCLFCFVDQMPKGMRPSLYLKDDDYRQSFLHGNFITLTNVSDFEIDRIIRLNLSPLYVSVQVTDAEVRTKLLGNRFAGDILNKLKKLSDNGIKIHTQVVLVPNVNDGALLDKTCNDLFSLKNVLSIAVVPCGITKHRQGLYNIEDIDKGYSRCVIEQVKSLNKKFNKNLVTLADEFYLKAQVEFENEEFYQGYPQIENGVGLTVKFKSEIENALIKSNEKGKYLVVSGTSASDFIKSQTDLIKNYVKNAEIFVLPIENEFFGKTVTCTGLLVGCDIINAVKPHAKNYEYLVIPSVCLKCDELVFLDGITVSEIVSQTGLKVIITDGSGESFVSAFTGGKNLK